MSDENTSENTGTTSATAVAAPPAPPAAPPKTGAAAPGPGPRRKHTTLWVTLSLVALAIVFVGGVMWLISSVRSNSGSTVNAAATQTAFASAMKKAGVTASYPPAPVDLTTITSNGNHQFKAVFTPEEVAALMNTFPYTSDVAGTQIAMSRAKIAFPSPGTINLKAQVVANGGNYYGDVALPATFSGGLVNSTGVTDLTIEGISADSGQKAQVTDALVQYANSLLSSASGLKVDTASIEVDGLHVTGTAPDSLAYP